MQKMSQTQAKKIYSELLVQKFKLDKNDLDWRLIDLVSGYDLGSGRYRLKVKNDWHEPSFECVELSLENRVIFYESFRIGKKKHLMNYEGEIFNDKKLLKVSPYVVGIVK